MEINLVLHLPRDVTSVPVSRQVLDGCLATLGVTPDTRADIALARRGIRLAVCPAEPDRGGWHVGPAGTSWASRSYPSVQPARIWLTSASSAGLPGIAPCVREKRGAGAAWRTPSRLTTVPRAA